MWETALAQSGQAQGGGALGALLPFVLIIIIFYFMLIRPQRKQAKMHRDMLAALSVGDEVMTAGGIFGKVLSVGENAVQLEVGGMKMAVQKQSVQVLLPAGTLDKIIAEKPAEKPADKPAS